MLKFDTESTICAISAGQHGSPRGVIRITGPDAVAIVSSVFGVTTPRRATRIPSQLNLGRFGLVPVDLFLWPDFRSYTGQPSAELHCFGAPVLLQQLQKVLLDNGIVLAQPGEFTLRAFLAGKLDLTQCEAVLGVIHASNERTLDVALKQLSGGLAEPLQVIRRELIHLLADIEAGLDFVDEDISFISSEQVAERLLYCQERVQMLVNQMTARSGQVHHLQVVLTGKPNAGKSSLLNALAKLDVAIVSPIPGTTRDFVRYRFESEGVTFDLLDTAGIEFQMGDSPRAQAQLFANEAIRQSDLVLHCIPCHDGLMDFEDHHVRSSELPANRDTTYWIVRTKADLGFSPNEIAPNEIPSPSNTLHWVSATSNQGIEALRLALVSWAKQHYSSLAEVVPMTAERCFNSLTRTSEAIREAIIANELQIGDEIVAGEIRIALDEIGQMAGTVYTDDILDALFSRFCIGK